MYSPILSFRDDYPGRYEFYNADFELSNCSIETLTILFSTMNLIKESYDETFIKYMKYLSDWKYRPKFPDSDAIVSKIQQSKKACSCGRKWSAVASCDILLKQLSRYAPRDIGSGTYINLTDYPGLSKVPRFCPDYIRRSILIRKTGVEFYSDMDGCKIPGIGEITFNRKVLFPCTDNINQLRIVYHEVDGRQIFSLRCEGIVSLEGMIRYRLEEQNNVQIRRD